MIVFTKTKSDKSLGSLKRGICGNHFKTNSDIYISKNRQGATNTDGFRLSFNKPCSYFENLHGSAVDEDLDLD